jgi:hypothetical protein
MTEQTVGDSEASSDAHQPTSSVRCSSLISDFFADSLPIVWDARTSSTIKANNRSRSPLVSFSLAMVIIKNEAMAVTH